MPNYAITAKPTLVIHVHDAENIDAAKQRVRAYLENLQTQQPLLGVVVDEKKWFGGALLLDEKGNPMQVPDDDEIALREREVAEFTKRSQEDHSPTWKWVLEAAQVRLNEARKLRVLAGLE